MEAIYQDVTVCPRCERSHLAIRFVPMANPILDKYVYWARCPMLDQPILAEVIKPLVKK